MKIGEIARQSGVGVETIRYYEKIGLLPAPDRDVSGYRHYRPSHLRRLLFIKRCRNLDMAQEEIRELVRLADQPNADCTRVDALLDRHLHHVRERLEELHSLERTLADLQQACSEGRTVAECGILGGLTANLEAEPTVQNLSHIPGSHTPRDKS